MSGQPGMTSGAPAQWESKTQFSFLKERKSPNCLSHHILRTYAVWFFAPLVLGFFGIFLTSRSRDVAMERAIHDLRSELDKELELNAAMSRKMTEDMKTLQGETDNLWKAFGHRTLQITDQMNAIDQMSGRFGRIPEELNKTEVELNEAVETLKHRVLRGEEEDEEAFEKRMMPNLHEAVFSILDGSAAIQPTTVSDVRKSLEDVKNSQNANMEELKSLQKRHEVLANAEKASSQKKLDAIDQDALPADVTQVIDFMTRTANENHDATNNITNNITNITKNISNMFASMLSR